MASYKCKDFADIGKCFQKQHVFIDTEVEILKVKQEQIDDRVKYLKTRPSLQTVSCTTFITPKTKLKGTNSRGGT